jgi:hypothetical protein
MRDYLIDTLEGFRFEIHAGEGGKIAGSE